MAPEIASIIEALPVQTVGPEEARPFEVSGTEQKPSSGEATALEVLAALREEEEEEKEDVEGFSLQPRKRQRVSSESFGMEAGGFTMASPSPHLLSPLQERLASPIAAPAHVTEPTE